MKKPIYTILKSVQNSDGTYPEGFNIYAAIDEGPGPNKDGIAGDKDANSLYFTEEDLVSELECSALLDAMIEYKDKNKHKYNLALNRIYRMIMTKLSFNVTPVFIKLMYENPEKYPPDFFVDFAINELITGTSVEGIKFALELFYILDIDQVKKQVPDIVNIIKTFAYYDEFSLQAILAIRSWENGHKEAFDVYTKSRLWGKVHVLELMDRFNIHETGIILEDIARARQKTIHLFFDNFIEKSSMLELIEKGLNPLQLLGLLNIIEYIFVYINKKGNDKFESKYIGHLLNLTLNEIKRYKTTTSLTLPIYDRIYFIYLNLSISDLDLLIYKDDFEEILNDPECENAVKKSVDLGFFEYFGLANNYNIKLTEPIIKAIEDNPSEAIKIAERSLYFNNVEIDKILSALVNTYDFSFMERKDKTTSVSLYRSKEATDMMILLLSLNHRPYKGKELITTALKSKYKELPLIALRTLIHWRTNGKLIWELIPDIKSQLLAMLDYDIPEIEKAIINALLTENMTSNQTDNFTKNVLSHVNKLYESEIEENENNNRLN